jgi:hypothetical protein
MFEGKVTLRIPRGADDTWMDELHGAVSRIEGAHVVGESGLSDKITQVDLQLDRPVALLSTLQHLPGVKQAIVPKGDGQKPRKRRLPGWSGPKSSSITLELVTGASG